MYYDKRSIYVLVFSSKQAMNLKAAFDNFVQIYKRPKPDIKFIFINFLGWESVETEKAVKSPSTPSLTER